MLDKFTKADLKDRMVVELHDGTRYMVIGDYLVNKYDLMIYIPQYDDNLYNHHEWLDNRVIDKVYEPCKSLDIDRFADKVIWSRYPDKKLKELKVKQSKINEMMTEYYKARGYELQVILDDAGE